MPVIYGEGFESAFYRLQMEIFQATGDYFIFACSFADKQLGFVVSPGT